MSGEYELMRRVVYGGKDDEMGQAIFIPVCPKCGRFVKPDDTNHFELSENFAPIPTNNATCSQCGRVSMPFEGFF